MAVSDALERRVSGKLTLVIALLLVGIVVFLVVAALTPEQTLPAGYRIESQGSGQSILVDATSASPIASPDVVLERVTGPWIIVKDGDSVTPTRYYLVDSRSGQVTQSTDLVALLRITREN